MPGRTLSKLALALTLLLVVPARADDWSLTRPESKSPASGRRKAQKRTKPGAPRAARAASSPDRRRTLMERYLRVLLRDPQQSFALDRLLALYRERDGNLDRLATELQAREPAKGSPHVLPMLRGQVALARGEADAARAAFSAAADAAPGRPGPLLVRARLERDSGALALARQLMEQALPLISRKEARITARRQLAELCLDMEDYAAAETHYRSLSAGLKGSVFQVTEYAGALAARKRFPRAVAAYRAALKRLRGDGRVLPNVLLQMARAQLGVPDLDGALATLARARKLVRGTAGVRHEIDQLTVEAHRRAGKLDELADRLSRERGGGFERSALLGGIYDELGQHAEALAALRRALSRRPNATETRQQVIRILTRQGKLEEAAKEYGALRRLAPREPRFLVELAKLLMELGRRDEALAVMARAGRRHPREAPIHRALFELYSRWGQTELAARELALLSRIEPDDPSHLLALGEQQFEEGDRAGALATWRRLLNRSADRAKAHGLLGNTYLDHDMPERALAEFQAAVALRPQEVSHVRGLAESFERLRRFTDAVAQWERLMASGSEDPLLRREARRRMVRIWSESGTLRERVSGYERAFGWTVARGNTAPPTGFVPDAESGRFLAECYRVLGRARQRRPSDPRYLRAVQEVLARVVELEPGDLDSMLALERARTSSGDVDGAIQVLGRLVEADPRNARSYLSRMAESALTVYRDDEAIAYAARVVSLSPGDSRAHRRLGDLYRARQEVDKAIASYERAIELNAGAFSVHFTLAELHLSRGDGGAADRLLLRVLHASPDDDLVKRATRALISLLLGTDGLTGLEQSLLPLALGHPQRPVFRNMLLELYDALARPLIERERGSGAAAAEARRELARLGGRAVKPLLEALADRDPVQRRIAIDILRRSQNPNAALPLLNVAEAEGATSLRREALLAAEDGVEEGEGPLAFEEVLGGDVVGGLVALVAVGGVGGGGCFDGDVGLAAAAFFGGGFFPFVGEEALHEGEEEGAQAALFFAGAGESVALEEAVEECLGEVFGFVVGSAAAADVGVEGKPVEAAEVAEGAGGGVGVFVAEGEDEAPARVWESAVGRGRGSCRRDRARAAVGSGSWVRWGGKPIGPWS